MQQSRTRVASAAALAAVTVLAGVAPACATSSEPSPRAASVTLAGKGFGHGVGMSQYGARNRAEAGHGYRRIIGFYYPGTSWGRAAGKVRILLSGDTSQNVVVLARSGMKVRSLGSGRTWTLPAKRGGTQVTRWRITPADGGARSTVSYRTGSWHRWRTVPGDAEFTAGGRPITLVTPGGRDAYRGALRSATGSATGGGSRDTVNVLPLEAYLRGVVAREVPGGWPQAAVRAQAVAARTYAAFERAAAPGGRHYDLCDTTSCQVYAGVAGEYSRTDRAIRATAGRIVEHRGGPAFTQFSASNGGWTAAGRFPYLPAKRDRFDRGAPGDPWRVTFTAAEITRHWPGLGTLRSVRVVERDGNGSYGGRAVRVEVRGSKSSVTVSGTTFQSYLGLRSTMFRVR